MKTLQTTLHRLTDADGPFVSVSLDSSHDTEDATRQSELRWRALRAELGEQGADEPTLAAMDEAIGAAAPPSGKAGRYLVAAKGEVLLDEQLFPPPATPVARVSPLPYLLPLVELTPKNVAHVVAVVDQTGADLRAVDAKGAGATARTVAGQKHQVHKVGGGGWSHHNVQQRSEDITKRNLDEVAGEVTRLVDQVGARVLVLAGEVQSRSALRAALPPRCREVVIEVEAGGRAAGTDQEALDREIRRVVREQADSENRTVLDWFLTESGRSGGRVQQGIGPTAKALREANVEVLLVADTVLDDRTVWTGAAQAQVAQDPEDLPDTGKPSRRRADEALPMAALAVGADIVVADERLRLVDDVGVLMRHE